LTRSLGILGSSPLRCSINALGRGQDRESLTAFIGTIVQALGPEQMLQYINADEAIKRLAAAQGIDVLNLVKSIDQIETEAADAAQAEEDMALMSQAGQLMKSPMADPTKNPMAGETVNAVMGEDVIPPMQ